MNYDNIRQTIAASMRSSSACCSKGYAALLRTTDAESLARVCIRFWADLNHALWPQFQAMLRAHYNDVRQAFNAYGIFYNESSDIGHCVVDDDAAVQLEFRRRTEVAVHGSAFVLLRDNASASLFDSSRAVARDTSSVTAYDRSFVIAYDSTRIRATGNSHVKSHGSTIVFLSDTATIQADRVHRIDYARPCTDASR